MSDHRISGYAHGIAADFETLGVNTVVDVVVLASPTEKPNGGVGRAMKFIKIGLLQTDLN